MGMRLLNSRTKQLELLHYEHLPPYAIISRRWGDELEEVLFSDIGDQARAKSKGNGYRKLQGSCDQAIQDEIHYIWLDTCCIDKSNSTELSEAINSMYKWYNRARFCYAYLHDVSDPSKFTDSDWFSRGWTLQELVAPKTLKFFTKDWRLIGTREELIDHIVQRTGINPETLYSGKIPPEGTISQKMFWASERETTKVEDRAYSLLGILGVNMAPIYGIDDAAFKDLQHKIIEEYPDQTLFAWYHTVTRPTEIDVEVAVPASYPASDPPIEDISASSLSMTSTGILASSPSQYLKSYEISEYDFRRNYVDRIRDHSYPSHFSISNNLVHISLPVKHMKEKIWKAVLRCSFEPPNGDHIQRPLVIYLEEVQPWKYLRLHFAPSNKGEGGNLMENVQGVPGSLEQLDDEESHLEGYALRDIDVVARRGECSSDDQQRPPFGDPDALSDGGANCIALERHPPGVKTINIIVCGEPGVATSRVINLITDGIVIKPLTDYARETMAVTPIDATLKSRNILIFYIVGPRDPHLDLDVYKTAIRHLYQFVQLAKEAGGVHLVLLCMVGSKITRTVESNYRLFHDYICAGKVPMMLIVTGLGKMRRMDDWWEKHKSDRVIQAMRIAQHACITVLQSEDTEHRRNYRESIQRIQQLLIDFMEGPDPTLNVYCPENGNQWFTSIGKQMMELLLCDQKSLQQDAIMKMLKEGLNLDEAEAGMLAGQFFGELAMEL